MYNLLKLDIRLCKFLNKFIKYQIIIWILKYIYIYIYLELMNNINGQSHIYNF